MKPTKYALAFQSRQLELSIVFALYCFCIFFTYQKIKSIKIALICLALPFLAPKSKIGYFLHSVQSSSPSFLLTQINIPMTAYVIALHLLFAYSVREVYREASVLWQTYAFAFLLWPITVFGFTAGVHRLWSHRSYAAAAPLRFILMLLHSVCGLGTIFDWARDHRVHHKFSETPADPSNAERGFWFSHIGWLIWNRDPAVAKEGQALNLNDLANDYFVLIQKACDPYWNLIFCWFLPSATCLLWGDSLWNGFLVAGVIRYFIIFHAVMCVNSVIHRFGVQPYAPDEVPSENILVTILALGEGWHSYHHAFPNDYATSELDFLEQFNPTKMILDMLACFGLVYDRKRCVKYWDERVRRWVEEKEKATGKKQRAVLSTYGLPFFRIRHVDIVEHLE